MEEDGTVVEEAEKICDNALFLMTEHGEGIWCKKTAQLCYKALDEECEFEEPVSVF